MGARSVVHLGYQYVVYYGPKDKTYKDPKTKANVPYAQIKIARRKLDGSPWEYSTLKGYRLTSEDAHNRQSIGISKGDGVIHIAFDHHNNRELRYARTAKGTANRPGATRWNNDTFTYVPNLGLPTLKGQQTTYPAFNAFPGGNIMLNMRNGHANGGEMFVALYDAGKGKWVSTRYVSSRKGTYKKTGSKERGPYTAGGMRVDADGNLHVAWVWREESFCYNGVKVGIDCNQGLYYAQSDDEGVTWENNAGNFVANTSQGGSISINNIGKPIKTLNHNLRPSNVAISSTYDLAGDEMHVMINHKTSEKGKDKTHHYIRGKGGKWRGGPSSFTASDVELAFQGDKIFALAGRRDGAIYYASRGDNYSQWTEIKLPKLPNKMVIGGGYTTWDTSMLHKGQLFALWHTQPKKNGQASPIESFRFKVGDVQ